MNCRSYLGLFNVLIIFVGSYEHSCFGCSLETLCYLKVPIRDIPIGKLMELVSNYLFKNVISL